jgi:hypothetical protein
MATHLILLLITLSIAVLAATLTAVAAGLLAWLGGARPPSAILSAGVAFGGTLTLELLIIGLVLSVLVEPRGDLNPYVVDAAFAVARAQR